MYNTHDVNILDTLLADEYSGEVNGAKITGRESAKAAVEGLLTAFPDVHFHVEDIFAESQKSVVRWRAQGTHLGSFAGLPPTGKPVTMFGITVFEVGAAQIRALWNVWDVQGLLAQLRG